MISQTVTDKFKLSVLNTRKFKLLLKDFLKHQYNIFKVTKIKHVQNEGQNVDIDFVAYENLESAGNNEFDPNMILGISEILYQMDSSSLIPEILFDLVTEKINQCVSNFESQTQGQMTQPFLARLLEYFQTYCKHFVEIVYSKIVTINEKFKTSINHTLNQLIFYVY
mmetsp:Transcript_14586/g.12388  ORF Transcript_14586/g.12388 Transcript_14586/m.12388 type:complete len:167 (+) Transcript_14586:453-953(+)